MISIFPRATPKAKASIVTLALLAAACTSDSASAPTAQVGRTVGSPADELVTASTAEPQSTPEPAITDCVRQRSRAMDLVQGFGNAGREAREQVTIPIDLDVNAILIDSNSDAEAQERLGEFVEPLRNLDFFERFLQAYTQRVLVSLSELPERCETAPLESLINQVDNQFPEVENLPELIQAVELLTQELKNGASRIQLLSRIESGEYNLVSARLLLPVKVVVDGVEVEYPESCMAPLQQLVNDWADRKALWNDRIEQLRQETPTGVSPTQDAFNQFLAELRNPYTEAELFELMHRDIQSVIDLVPSECFGTRPPDPGDVLDRNALQPSELYIDDSVIVFEDSRVVVIR